MKGAELKGHLDLLLLAIVQAQPLHGYAIMEELRRRSGGSFDLPEGTIYPALHRLEAAKLLKSSWEKAGGRRRRVYTLTAAGKGALSRRRDRWDSFSTAVQGVLGTT